MEDKLNTFMVNKHDRIVIPREFAYSFTSVLHRRFDHPNKTQMSKLFNRRYYMLDCNEIISKVTDNCDFPCRALKKIPKETLEFQIETIPESFGSYFNADVIQESGQKILLVRENLTSLTDAMFIQNEQKETLREAIILLTLKLRTKQQISIRVDAQSSLKALEKDLILKNELISLDIGSPKNKNKNSVAEKGIRELREEFVKIQPHGGKMSELTLAKAVTNLNSRIRHAGCSARELCIKRDQDSGEPIHFEDSELSKLQYQMRLKSHKSSAAYQSRNAPKVQLPKVKIGDMIFIKSDLQKNKAREPYIILDFVFNS